MSGDEPESGITFRNECATVSISNRNVYVDRRLLKNGKKRDIKKFLFFFCEYHAIIVFYLYFTVLYNINCDNIHNFVQLFAVFWSDFRIYGLLLYALSYIFKCMVSL